MPAAEVSIGVSMDWRRRQPPPEPPPAVTRRFVVPVVAYGTIDQTAGVVAYTALGYSSSWGSDETAVRVRTAIDLTVTSWTVQLNAPLPQDETLTFRLVIDGTPSVTLPLFMFGDGAQTGARSTTGSLQIPAGSTVSIKGSAGDASAASALILGFMLACTAEKAVCVVRSAGSESVAQRWAWSGAGGNGGTAANFTALSNQDWWLNPLPGTVTFERLAAQNTFQPSIAGVIQPRVGGAASGGSVQYANSDTVTGDVSSPVTRPAIGADLATTYADVLIDAIPAGEDGIIVSLMSAYSVADPYADFCVLYSGKTLGTLSLLGSTSGRVAGRQMPNAKQISYGATLDDVGLSLGNFNLRWPNLPGTVRHFLAAVLTGNSVATPYTITAVFRKNDVDAISVESATVTANTPQVLIDDATSVAVIADDLVCFGAFASTNDNFNSGSGVAYGIGFEAD